MSRDRERSQRVHGFLEGLRRNGTMFPSRSGLWATLMFWQNLERARALSKERSLVELLILRMEPPRNHLHPKGDTAQATCRPASLEKYMIWVWVWI
jgi:hypothetical protein